MLRCDVGWSHTRLKTTTMTALRPDLGSTQRTFPSMPLPTQTHKLRLQVDGRKCFKVLVHCVASLVDHGSRLALHLRCLLLWPFRGRALTRRKNKTRKIQRLMTMLPMFMCGAI